MSQTFAAEGGYQIFTLGSQEWFWLIFAVAVALIALVTGWFMMRSVLAKDTGTEKMQEIAGSGAGGRDGLHQAPVPHHR